MKLSIKMWNKMNESGQKKWFWWWENQLKLSKKNFHLKNLKTDCDKIHFFTFFLQTPRKISINWSLHTKQHPLITCKTKIPMKISVDQSAQLFLITQLRSDCIVRQGPQFPIACSTISIIPEPQRNEKA